MTLRKRKTAPLTVLQRQERIWAKLNAAAVRDGVQIVDKHTGKLRQATWGEAKGEWMKGIYRMVKVESETK